MGGICGICGSRAGHGGKALLFVILAAGFTYIPESGVNPVALHSVGVVPVGLLSFLDGVLVWADSRSPIVATLPSTALFLYIIYAALTGVRGAALRAGRSRRGREMLRFFPGADRG